MEEGMSSAKYNIYFPHDSNAKDDPKIMLLIAQLGIEAYGIYWILIEYLREQPGYQAPLLLLDPLSRRYGASKEKFEAIVKNFGLFESDDFNFRSPSLITRMVPLENKREQQKLNAKKRWEKDAMALPRQCDGITTAMQSKVKESKVKKSKVKESKEEKNIIPPSFDMVSKFCQERKNSINVSQFFNFYEAKGWKIGKERMKDWQAAIRTWEQRTESNPTPGEDSVARKIKEVTELLKTERDETRK
jgi:hypothetical protein